MYIQQEQRHHCCQHCHCTTLRAHEDAHADEHAHTHEPHVCANAPARAKAHAHARAQATNVLVGFDLQLYRRFDLICAHRQERNVVIHPVLKCKPLVMLVFHHLLQQPIKIPIPQPVARFPAAAVFNWRYCVSNYVLESTVPSIYYFMAMIDVIKGISELQESQRCALSA